MEQFEPLPNLQFLNRAVFIQLFDPFPFALVVGCQGRVLLLQLCDLRRFSIRAGTPFGPRNATRAYAHARRKSERKPAFLSRWFIVRKAAVVLHLFIILFGLRNPGVWPKKLDL